MKNQPTRTCMGCNEKKAKKTAESVMKAMVNVNKRNSPEIKNAKQMTEKDRIKNLNRIYGNNAWVFY